MQPATQRAVLWLLPLVILGISAVPTNRTVDDGDPLVQYLEPGIAADSYCHRCSGTVYGLDNTQLVNHTVSVFTAPRNLASARPAVQISFTGTAIYIFFAMPPFGGGGGHQCCTASSYWTVFKLPATDAFDSLFFDYAIYTVDTEAPPISGSTSLVSGSTSPASSSTSPLTGTSSSGTPGPESNPSSGKDRVPIAAGIAGGIVILLATAAGLSLWKRARRRNLERTSALEKADPPGGTLAPIEQAGQEATALAEELRIVKEQLHRLAQRVDGNSAAASDADATVPLRPSLSTMKRDQTRSIRDQRPGSVAHDALVHTDSGLRLTAGRGSLVDELPPNYVAE
ncbi:hypothetical protein B0H19DRAFT_1228129 [Mycena capillaripes]|nr:hypothetical protein B0H19DRAFT_1228129 [Mycena capillaripes]